MLLKYNRKLISSGHETMFDKGFQSCQLRACSGVDHRRLSDRAHSVWGATQWVAWRFGYQAQLGQPWFEFPGLPVYPPPALFWSWY
jgi:hypothetical protein